MRRVASEILQELEIRVARLEMQSTRNKKALGGIARDTIDSSSLESELVEEIYLKYDHHIPSHSISPIWKQETVDMVGYALFYVRFDRYHAVVELRGRQYSLLFLSSDGTATLRYFDRAIRNR